jgi:hypothetical protein
MNCKVHYTYKAKAVPLHAIKASGREDVYLLLILDLGTRCGEWSASRPGLALSPVPIVRDYTTHTPPLT